MSQRSRCSSSADRHRGDRTLHTLLACRSFGAWRHGGGRHPCAIVLIVAAAVALPTVAATAAIAQAGGSSRPPVWLHHWAPAGTDFFLGTGLARSATGDLFVAGNLYNSASGHYEWCVSRYTDSGSRKWVRTLATSAGDDSVYAVAADAAGNVIVAGSVQTATHDRDGLVAKWSRSGKLLWKRQLDGTSHGVDYLKDVAVAPDGSTVAVGTQNDTTTNDDGVIVKYAPTGKLLWKHLYDGAAHGSDAFTAVALDTAGNAYAAGYDYAPARADDALLIRYSPKGHALWTRHYGNSVALKHEWFSDVAVRGNYVVAAGITESDPVSINWEDRGLLIKYKTTTGSRQWTRQFVNPTNPLFDAEWTLVGIDGKGRVAVAGDCATSSTTGDEAWATTVYSAAGVAGPLQTEQGSFAQGNRPTALVSTAGGTVFETGYLANTTTSQDLYTLALRSTGAPLWGSMIDDSHHANDDGCGLATTSKAVYVGATYYTDLALAKYAR